MGPAGWALRALVRWRARTGSVRRRLQAMPPPAPAREPRGPDGRVRVAAVQLRFALVEDGEEFAERLHRVVALAVDQGAQLVVLPLHTGLLLWGLVPTLARMVADSLVQGASGDDVRTAIGLLGPEIGALHRLVLTQLARLLGVWLVGGSALRPTRQGVRHESWVVDPEGRVVLTARPVLPGFLDQFSDTQKPEPATWETPWGRMSLVPGADAATYERVRLARREGAEVVAVPAAEPAPYRPLADLASAWARAQESQVFVVRSCLVGHALDVSLAGRSGVYAPLALTPGGNGIVAEVASSDAEGVATADLDLEALRRYRAASPMVRLPEGLEEELGRAYAQRMGGAPGGGSSGPAGGRQTDGR